MRGCRLLLVLLIVAGTVSTARAIPPFARRYGFACSTCHVGGPTKLSEFGEAFRDNGYRIPGDNDSFLREKPLPLGDPARAELFPSAMWPGELPSMVPIGVAGEVNAQVTIPGGGQPISVEPEAVVRLLAGGSLGSHFSYLAEIYASSVDGFELPQINLVARGLLEPFTDNATLNLKIGRILPDLLPVTPALRRGFTEGFGSSLSVGSDGFTYGMAGDGIELWGTIAGRLKWVAGMVNGTKPISDTSTRRDLFGRLQVKIGGERYDYRGAHPESKGATNFQLGVAAYWGATVIAQTPSAGDPTPANKVNRIERLSADLRLRSHGLDLIAIGVLGRDSDPDGNQLQVDSLALSGEIDWAPLPWLQPFARYDEARFSVDAGHPLRRRVTGGFAIFARANVRLVIEGTYGISDGEPSFAATEVFFAL